MPSIRVGESRHHIFNSGLEVWLYDDSQRDAIRRSGAMEFGNADADPIFDQLTQDGQIVGYSLWQDDELDISVIVGKPLTGDELTEGRWLDPQRAWLRLPSGVLRIDSNDSCPLLNDDPTDRGAQVVVQPGNYIVTLYRVDHEALEREEMEWDGPQEIIVLTRGGSPADAAATLLPFEQRRDLSWVGKASIKGSRAEVLVWFSDRWDTCYVNLDAAGMAQLGITPGTYLRIDAPAAGLTMISVFDESWKEGALRPPPATGSLPDEYGYCAVSPLADWDGAPALLCRRVRTARAVPDAHLNTWMPGTIDRLDLKPGSPVQAGSREFRPIQFHDLQYYDPDFLPLILSDVLGEIEDDEPFEAIVTRLDQGMKKLGLNAPADYSWVERDLSGEREFAVRLYSGAPNMMGAIHATEGSIEVLLLSELADGGWVVSGLADQCETRLVIGTPRPSIRLQNLDEPLKKIHAAHTKALAKAGAVKPAPAGGKDTLAAFDRFLVAAFN